jgi:hypothetical protein
MRRHPWVPVALTGRRTLGPNTLKALDHVLGLLEPSGLPPRDRAEALALVSGFVASHVGYEVAQQQALGRTSDVRQFAESNARYMAGAVASGAYPHLAAAMAADGAGPELQPDPDETFERLLARVISGLG